MNKNEFELKIQLDYLEKIYSFLDNDDGSEASNIAHNNLKVINLIRNGIVPSSSLLHALIHPENEETVIKEEVSTYSNMGIYSNEFQQEAVNKALNMNNLLVIQGPPGTGKTTVISEIIHQLLRKNKSYRFLLSSSSHQAVDNVFERIAKLDNPNFKLLRIKDKDTNEVSERFGVDAFINNCINDDNEKIIKKLFRYKNSLIKYIYGRAGLVGVTSNAIIGCCFNYSEVFDYAIIDETGKETTTEILTAFLFAKKVILIGDPKQLPPVYGTYLNEYGVSQKEFNHLKNNPYINYIFENIHPSSKVFLGKQFRMSNDIGTFISHEFYNGKLQNGRDFPIEHAFNFLDYDVNNSNYSPSNLLPKVLINKFEINLIKNLLKTFDNEKSIAIMSPYSDQIAAIKKEIKETDKIKIATVDSFQGGECDYVIYSATRNHDVTGFQKMPNRINVAISRARERFFLIGNKEYLDQIPFWKDLFEFQIDGKIVVNEIKK